MVINVLIPQKFDTRAMSQTFTLSVCMLACQVQNYLWIDWDNRSFASDSRRWKEEALNLTYALLPFHEYNLYCIIARLGQYIWVHERSTRKGLFTLNLTLVWSPHQSNVFFITKDILAILATIWFKENPVFKYALLLTTDPEILSQVIWQK